MARRNKRSAIRVLSECYLRAGDRVRYIYNDTLVGVVKRLDPNDWIGLGVVVKWDNGYTWRACPEELEWENI